MQIINNLLNRPINLLKPTLKDLMIVGLTATLAYQSFRILNAKYRKANPPPAMNPKSLATTLKDFDFSIISLERKCAELDQASYDKENSHEIKRLEFAYRHYLNILNRNLTSLNSLRKQNPGTEQQEEIDRQIKKIIDLRESIRRTLNEIVPPKTPEKQPPGILDYFYNRKINKLNQRITEIETKLKELDTVLLKIQKGEGLSIEELSFTNPKTIFTELKEEITKLKNDLMRELPEIKRANNLASMLETLEIRHEFHEQKPQRPPMLLRTQRRF